jgi:hypothetical protein
MSASDDFASKVRLRQFAKMLDELANAEWPADDWPRMQSRTQHEFDELRKKAKQLLGQKDGEEFWEKTNLVLTEQPSRLEQKEALQLAIREAAKLLRTFAPDSSSGCAQFTTE